MNRSPGTRAALVPALLLALAAFLAAGCTPKADITIPPDPDTGTITVDPNPTALEASWSLNGPSSTTIEGTGDTTISAALTGDWTITWGAVEDYYQPDGETLTLETDLTITFTTVYVEIPPDPNEVLITVQPGAYTMGSPLDEPGRYGNENPHAVAVNNAFRMQATEVTWGQYVDNLQWAFVNGHASVSADSVYDSMGGEPVLLLDMAGAGGTVTYADSVFVATDPMLPAADVTWYGAAAYCDWLSLRTGLTPAYDHDGWTCNGGDPYGAEGVRLPTEAEWEYACRAGTSTAFSFGPITDLGFEDAGLDTTGWYGGNTDGGTEDVSTLDPNAWGFYDMHGNLWEWCNDWYARDLTDELDPVGPASGERKVFRGGFWGHYARGCRSASRAAEAPGFCGAMVGFRVVISGEE